MSDKSNTTTPQPPPQVGTEVASEASEGLQALMLPTVDLRTLLSEMAALKAEVRAETTAARELREQMQEALAPHKTPTRDHNAQHKVQEETRRNTIKEAATALIDTLDRLTPAMAVAHQLAQPKRRWWRTHVDPAAASLHEGLRLSIQRLHNQLARWEITPLDALHQPFDPNTMEALDTSSQQDIPDAHVTEVITQGYRGPQGMLRFAQVIVNKRTTPTSLSSTTTTSTNEPKS